MSGVVTVEQMVSAAVAVIRGVQHVHGSVRPDVSIIATDRRINNVLS